LGKKKINNMEHRLYSSIIGSLRSSKRFIYYVILILAVLYLLSGVYSVSQNEIGVLQRFGRVINKGVMPGIHTAFPWPIDKVDKVPVRIMKRISIDDFSQEYSPGSIPALFYEFTGLSSYCITGDNNIVNFSCALQYSIADPVRYLFYIRNSENVLHSVISNAIIHCLSRLPVDEVLTYGKREIEIYIKNRVQEVLNNINCGLNISFVELKKVSPPAEVQKYFDDVINSKIDKKKVISKAESYWNEKMPEVSAQANQMIEEARSYKNEVIAKAEGDSQRFLDILNRYKKSKGLTRKRFYLECIKEALYGVDEVYVISSKDGKVPAKIKLFNVKE